MHSFKKILALAAIFMLAFIPFMISDDSDAVVRFSENSKVTGEFSDIGGGKLTVYLMNDNSTEATVTVKAFDGTTESQLASSTVTIPAKIGSENGKITCDLSWSYGNSGNKYVTVTVFDTSGNELDSESNINIYVSHSIWKDTTTYVVIIIVVIVIAIAAFIKIRGTPGSKKEVKDDKSQSSKVFTQMEEEKRAKKNSSSESSQTVPIDKQQYEAGESKRKSKRRGQ